MSPRLVWRSTPHPAGPHQRVSRHHLRRSATASPCCRFHQRNPDPSSLDDLDATSRLRTSSARHRFRSPPGSDPSRSSTSTAAPHYSLCRRHHFPSLGGTQPVRTLNPQVPLVPNRPQSEIVRRSCSLPSRRMAGSLSPGPASASACSTPHLRCCRLPLHHHAAVHAAAPSLPRCRVSPRRAARSAFAPPPPATSRPPCLTRPSPTTTSRLFRSTQTPLLPQSAPLRACR